MPSRLEKFKRQFQEEYGSNVEVPFCTIIDQNDFNGLSYLEKYQPSQDEKDQKIKQIVDEKILDCLQAQKEEINLSIDNFSSLEISREDRYPESFDLNFFVSKEKEHYRLWLAPIGGSGAPGICSIDLTVYWMQTFSINTKKTIAPLFVQIKLWLQ